MKIKLTSQISPEFRLNLALSVLSNVQRELKNHPYCPEYQHCGVFRNGKSRENSNLLQILRSETLYYI